MKSFINYRKEIITTMRFKYKIKFNTFKMADLKFYLCK